MFVVPVILASLAATDSLVFAQANQANAKKSMFLTDHALGSPILTGGAKASYLKFFTAGGKRPVRFVTGARLVGDERDELVVVRERLATGALDLLVVPAPTALAQKKPKILASLKEGILPNVESDEPILGIFSLDIDYDGRDELALLRRHLDGNQYLDVFDAPRKKNEKKLAARAKIEGIGMVGGDEVISAFELDLDTSSGNELGLYKRNALGAEWIDVHGVPFHDPALPWGPVALDPAIRSITISAVPSSIDRILPVREMPGSTSTSPLQGLALVRRVGVSETKIDLHAITAANVLPPAIADQSYFSGASAIAFLASLRQPTNDPEPPPPPPPPTFTGSYRIDCTGPNIPISDNHLIPLIVTTATAEVTELPNQSLTVSIPTPVVNLTLVPNAAGTQFTSGPVDFVMQKTALVLGNVTPMEIRVQAPALKFDISSTNPLTLTATNASGSIGVFIFLASGDNSPLKAIQLTKL